MGIDVMIVGPAEQTASRPSEAMFDWLEQRFDDFGIRYGCIALNEDDVRELTAKFEDDPVGAMLIAKVVQMRAAGQKAPHVIELMIGW